MNSEHTLPIVIGLVVTSPLWVYVLTRMVARGIFRSLSEYNKDKENQNGKKTR